MPNISLTSYALRIKDRITKSNIRISDTSSGFDIFEEFKEYLEQRAEGMAVDEAKQKMLRVADLKVKDRTLKGTIVTGVYGHESEMFDIDVMEVTHVRQETEAELIPFYFLMSFPEDTNEGIIILQKFMTYGIRRILLDDFRKHLENKDSPFTVNINPLNYADIIKKYLTEGNLKKLRFVSKRLPSDLTNIYEGEPPTEKDGYMEVTINAKRNRSIPVASRFFDYLDGKAEMGNILEIEDFEFDTIKCEVEINGRTRTIDLSRPTKIRSIHDITGKVKTEAGHPIFSSIDYLATDLLNDLLAEMRAKEEEE